MKPVEKQLWGEHIEHFNPPCLAPKDVMRLKIGETYMTLKNGRHQKHIRK